MVCQNLHDGLLDDDLTKLGTRARSRIITQTHQLTTANTPNCYFLITSQAKYKGTIKFYPPKFRKSLAARRIAGTKTKKKKENTYTYLAGEIWHRGRFAAAVAISFRALIPARAIL